MPTLCFNQVCVQKSAGGTNLLTPDAYLAIPQMERTTLMLDGKVTFLKSGTMVSPLEAIKSIMALKAS